MTKFLFVVPRIYNARVIFLSSVRSTDGQIVTVAWYFQTCWEIYAIVKKRIAAIPQYLLLQCERKGLHFKKQIHITSVKPSDKIFSISLEGNA